MSIDWLNDLERSIDNGRDVYATPSPSRNQWVVGDSVDELEKTAKRTVEHKKMPVHIVRLATKHDAMVGDLFLVPVEIGEPGPRGESSVKWSVVETKEAAEMMRDVRHGPSPFFAMQVEKTIDPPEDE